MAKNSVGLEWNGDKITKELMKRVELGIQAAAHHLRNQVVKNISIPTAVEGPSQPGEMPHADTGRLRQSISLGKVGELEWAVGTDVDYGLIHETGDRPFLRPTAYQELPRMVKIIEKVTGRKASIQIIEPEN
jgi:phage gpG-like protein